MIPNPKILGLDDLALSKWGCGAVWASDHGYVGLVDKFSFLRVPDLTDIPNNLDTLLVVGGGQRIDIAKAWRAENQPKVNLIALPTLWGSGAEASAIAVLNGNNEKIFFIGPEYLPDARIYHDALAADVPLGLALAGCGDTWAHALEGFLSPLATPETRNLLANLINKMLTLPLGCDARWFQVSAEACRGQALSSVGLIHGIAHVIEPLLRADLSGENWGHARLCGLLLWPAMLFNSTSSGNMDRLLAEHRLSLPAIFSIIRQFWDADAYTHILPKVVAAWGRILRDPCTRTNSTLVRQSSLDFFTNKDLFEQTA